MNVKEGMKRIIKKTLKQLFVCFLISFIGIMFLRNHLFLNNSPSVEVGFYWKEKADTLEKGDIVFYKISSKFRNFLLENKLISEKNKYILKIIGAVPGDKVVIKDHKLYINDKFIYEIIEKMGNGVSLNPIEKLDTILKKDEYFLIGEIKESYDSRYVGIVERFEIEGKAKLLYSTKKISQKDIEKMREIADKGKK